MLTRACFPRLLYHRSNGHRSRELLADRLLMDRDQGLSRAKDIFFAAKAKKRSDDAHDDGHHG